MVLDLGEVQEPEGVRDGRALLADALGDFVLGQLEIVDQDPVGLGLLDRVQLLALEVLDERQLEELLVGDVPDDRRDLVDAGALGRPPAALAGDQLEPAVRRAAGRRPAEAAPASSASGRARRARLRRTTGGAAADSAGSC